MSDADARPGGFVLRARYSRVECPEPDYAGLWAEIRTNLTNGERAVFVERVIEMNGEIEAHINALFAELRSAEADAKAADADALPAAQDRLAAARAALNTAAAGEDAAMTRVRDERLALIAPYVRAWNLCDADGADVPPPETGAPGCWAHADAVITAWLVREIEGGYRGGKGVRSSSSASAATPAPPSGPQIASEAAPST